ncbi:helix-turn-helix domain-containing protein [Polycladidibacter hongkongensis]|uniref:helix-turn-helix domain-containing protein n=1 Tax=Polycladidibacter hongkongensis TaxID=1647556 RepID=UPI000829BCC3|nr:helix-turn-helix domain-containing protein [Pseudovibrio hongkongensis]
MSERRPFREIKLQWLEQLLCDPDLSPFAKCLGALIVTRYINGHTEEAWPSYKTLADALNKSVKTIQRAIRELEQHEWFKVARGNGCTNSTRYRPTEKTILAACEAREKTGKVVPLPAKEAGQNCLKTRSNLSREHGQKCPPNKENKPNKNLSARKDAPPPNERRRAIPALFIKLNEQWKIDQWRFWLEQNGLPPLEELNISETRNGLHGYVLPSNCPPSSDDTERTQEVLRCIHSRLNQPTHVISFAEEVAS